MLRNLPLLLALCVGTASGEIAREPGTADLIGTWDDVTPEQEGVGFRPERSEVSVTFEESACTWEEPGVGKVRQSLYVPVAAGEHRGLDFMTVNSGKFWRTRALFRVEGDTLTIKEGAIDGARPTDLAPVEFDGVSAKDFGLLRIYKRRAK